MKLYEVLNMFNARVSIEEKWLVLDDGIYTVYERPYRAMFVSHCPFCGIELDSPKEQEPIETKPS